MSLEQMFDARSWIESQKFGSEIEIQIQPKDSQRRTLETQVNHGNWWTK